MSIGEFFDRNHSSTAIELLQSDLADGSATARSRRPKELKQGIEAPFNFLVQREGLLPKCLRTIRDVLLLPISLRDSALQSGRLTKPQSVLVMSEATISDQNDLNHLIGFQPREGRRSPEPAVVAKMEARARTTIRRAGREGPLRRFESPCRG